MRKDKKKKKITHLSRYKEIVYHLITYGFDEVFGLLSPAKLFFKKRRIKKGQKILRREERLRLLLEDLGPTFIKFGQILSNRPDIIPPSLAEELIKLRDDVAPFPDKEAFELLESELGKRKEELFIEIDNSPVASASIAQVYHARLMSGQKVAIKIQRPNIREIVDIDLDLMLHLAGVIEKLFLKGNVVVTEVLEEFSRQLHKELDFTGEARRIERFYLQNKNSAGITAPAVYKNLSTRKVLTMEYIEGIDIENIELLKQYDIDPVNIARIGTDNILQQIFKHGYFHADPHSGNMKVLKNGNICFLDFGAMGNLDRRMRINLAQLLLGVADQDAAKATYGLLSLASTVDIKNREKIQAEMYDLIEEYAQLPLRELNVRDIMQRFLNIIINNNLLFPPSLYMLIKTLITLESLGRKLDPDFVLIDYMRPHVEDFIKYNLRPASAVKNIPFIISEAVDVFNRSGFELPQLLERLKKGKIEVDLSDTDLKTLSHKIDQSTTRFSLSLIISAAIIGSSIIIQSKIPPLINGVSLLGIIGLTVTGVLGIALIVHFIRAK
ncbi:AarF/UbiB family protein [Spirochaetia bacterium 38H-sp]|uniref:AarF/UbiB family protein n=1 Tax=Rarispira pelagica TaxID=3141764 RepID=A0ABU9UAY4_9SPIR